MLEYKQSVSISSCNSIKTFDSTLYITISPSKLKDRLKELVQLCFIIKNGQQRYKYLVLGWDKFYFVEKHSDSTKTISQTDIIKMIRMFHLKHGMFGRHFLWVSTVLLFSPTCFFISPRQISYRGFWRKTKRS
jgi:hypothetical protein